jgi:hypothetical protein
MVRKVYRGWLTLASNGEEDDILYLVDEKDKSRWESYCTDPLADIIEDDLPCGKYLSVHFYTADKEIPENKIEEAFVMSLYGLGEVDYGMHYSDYTGYLWTDEEMKVGGHDLLEQLKSNNGKYCHLVIEFHKQPPPQVNS